MCNLENLSYQNRLFIAKLTIGYTFYKQMFRLQLSNSSVIFLLQVTLVRSSYAKMFALDGEKYFGSGLCLQVYNVWDWFLLKRTGVLHSDWCDSRLNCSTPAALAAKLHLATQEKIFFSFPTYIEFQSKMGGIGGEVFLKICAFYVSDCFVSGDKKKYK